MSFLDLELTLTRLKREKQGDISERDYFLLMFHLPEEYFNQLKEVSDLVGRKNFFNLLEVITSHEEREDKSKAIGIMHSKITSYQVHDGFADIRENPLVAQGFSQRRKDELKKMDFSELSKSYQPESMANLNSTMQEFLYRFRYRF